MRKLILTLLFTLSINLHAHAQDWGFSNSTFNEQGNQVGVYYYKDGYFSNRKVKLLISFHVNIESLALSKDKQIEVRNLLESHFGAIFDKEYDPLALAKAQDIVAPLNLRFLFKRKGKLIASCIVPPYALFNFDVVTFTTSAPPMLYRTQSMKIGIIDWDADYRNVCQNKLGRPIKSPKLLPGDQIYFMQSSKAVILSGRLTKNPRPSNGEVR